MKKESDLYNRLRRICKSHRVQIMYVFGSRAGEIRRFLNGEGELFAGERSDVDIGVKPAGDTVLDLREQVRLGIELEDFFGVHRVDLLVVPEVDPFVAANIIRGERIYCEDEYMADEYDLYILRRAGDLIHLERERLALALYGQE